MKLKWLWNINSWLRDANYSLGSVLGITTKDQAKLEAETLLDIRYDDTRELDLIELFFKNQMIKLLLVESLNVVSLFSVQKCQS